MRSLAPYLNLTPQWPKRSGDNLYLTLHSHTTPIGVHGIMTDMTQRKVRSPQSVAGCYDCSAKNPKNGWWSPHNKSSPLGCRRWIKRGDGPVKKHIQNSNLASQKLFFCPCLPTSWIFSGDGGEDDVIANHENLDCTSEQKNLLHPTDFMVNFNTQMKWS